MAPPALPSSSSEVALAAFDRHGTIGALEISVIVSVLFLGFATIQAYHYYSKFPDDHIALKLLVAFVMLCEYGQAISVCHTLYKTTVTSYGDPLGFYEPPKSLGVSFVFSSFLIPIVQGFFANRIRMLSHQMFIPMLCWFLSFLKFLGSLIASVETLKSNDLVSFQEEWAWLLTALLSVGACADVCIAISLSYYLMQQRSKAYKSTVRVIDKLVAWSIETGLLTSATEITMLICFVRVQGGGIWIGVLMLLGRLFSNSFLAVLNARESLRNMREPVVELSVSDRLSCLDSSGRNDSQRAPGCISIEVTRQKTTRTDSTNGQTKFAEHDRSTMRSSMS